MTHNIKNKLSCLGVMSAFFVAMLSSCSNEINLSGIDESGFDKADSNYVALKNYNDPRPMRTVELRDNGDTLKVNLRLSKALSQDYTANLTTDQAALAAYNSANGTSFKIFPAGDATFKATSATVSAGQTVSAPVDIVLKGGADLTVGTSYVLPVSFENTNSDVKTSNGEGTYLFVITYMGNKPDASKSSGIKTIMYIEVNDNNPLNAGEYTLSSDGSDNGKPFADIVTLFAANINYNAQTGRVYVSLNQQVTSILSNRDKYIKPLQDKGIKVDLAILGNHDIAGLSGMSIGTAKDFARQLKALVDTYGLDGIDFDDEYSAYADPPAPGFTLPSLDSYEQLVYYTKAAMPDKNVILYDYTDAIPRQGMPTVAAMPGTGFANPIVDENGVSHNPGDFIDFLLEPYYQAPNFTMVNDFLGMTKAQTAPYSRDCSQGLFYFGEINASVQGLYGLDYLQQMVDDGYKVNMLYNVNPNYTPGYASYGQKNDHYVQEFGDMAKIFYNAKIVYSGTFFAKDY